MVTVKESNVTHTAGDTFTPLALLTYPDTARQGIASVARRTAGDEIGTGTLTITNGQATVLGGGTVTLASDHQTAIAQAAAWLSESIDGSYPISFRQGHRAVVEADGNGVMVEATPTFDSALMPALALAWVLALRMARGDEPRLALRQVAAIYRAFSAEEQTALQHALANGHYDAGHLLSLIHI